MVKGKVKIIIIVSVLTIIILFQIQKIVEMCGEKTDVLVFDTTNKIEMYVLEESINSSGLTYCIKSNFESSVSFGPMYSLERYVMGNWYKVPILSDGIAYIAIEYSINEGETREFTIDWRHIYGNLPKGRYRLVKKFNKIQKGGIYIAAEFYMKGDIFYEK